MIRQALFAGTGSAVVRLLSATSDEFVGAPLLGASNRFVVVTCTRRMTSGSGRATTTELSKPR